MELFLTVVSGLAWTLVYVEAIRLGFRDRTFAIPVAALALNFAWEAIYTIQGFGTALSVQTFVNLAWALADVVIVYTYLRFGRREFTAQLTGAMFAGWSALLFGASFAVQLLFISEFGVSAAARYSAFLQNLLMSGLFISMLMARRGLRGQSLTIAVAKWVGTLAPTLLFGVLEGSALIIGVGALCSVFDIVYIGLVLWARRAFGAADASLGEARATT